ncbi:MAG: hypothetical protein AAGF77_05425, partial [Bacteroidota bacterium]
MKTILTILFIAFVSTAAMANTPAQKVTTITKGVNMEIVITSEPVQHQVARLYKFKNSRVKK